MNGSKQYGPSGTQQTSGKVPTRFAQHASNFRPSPSYLFSAMVGMARCAVPARVVAGGTNFRVAIEGVAPLHAARTLQRDVPTTLNRYSPSGRGRTRRWPSARTSAVSIRRTSRTTEPAADCSLSPWERVRVRGIAGPVDTATQPIHELVALRESSGRS